jgi:hypothetical protein
MLAAERTWDEGDLAVRRSRLLLLLLFVPWPLLAGAAVWDGLAPAGTTSSYADARTWTTFLAAAVTAGAVPLLLGIPAIALARRAARLGDPRAGHQVRLSAALLVVTLCLGGAGAALFLLHATGQL